MPLASPKEKSQCDRAEALQFDREAIRRIALRHRVTNVRVFGSVVHGDDTEESDLDLLVEPTNETTMKDIAKIQLELARLLYVRLTCSRRKPANQV